MITLSVKFVIHKSILSERMSKKQLERQFDFCRNSIKQRLDKIIIANFNTVCSINFASYVHDGLEGN